MPRLAHGGVIAEGDAMIAEAGPEVVKMVNGKAIVTPLTPSAKNTALGKEDKTNNTTNNINLNIEHFENNRQTDIKELTEEMLQTAEELKERDDRVYA